MASTLSRLAVVGWLLATLALAGCSLHRDPSSLRVAIAAPEVPSTLDPHRIASPNARFLAAALFDALTRVDEKGDLQPALAESWEPIGPTAWQFKLRSGVKFQDGEEFNAQTVAYNIRRVQQPDIESPILKVIPTLYRGNAPGPKTIVVTTRRPDPILPRRLASLYMIPIEYSQRLGNAEFGRNPVGTGPWKLNDFEPGVAVTIEAAKGSWRGAPDVRYLQVKQMPDPAQRAQAVAAGQVDVALEVPVEQRTPLEQQGMRVQELPISVSNLLILVATEEDSPLANPKVRQALNYAVDKDSLVKNVVGAGVVLNGQVVGKEANGYNDLQPPDKVELTYPYNLGEAKKLMQEAGFAEGFELPVYYTKLPDDRELKELNAIAKDLEPIKVKLALRPQEPAVHLQRRLAGTLTPAFYETIPYYPSQDASLVMDRFGLEKTESLVPTYDYEDFEEIYKLTRTENNPSLRRRALQVSMRLLTDSPPAIYLYQSVRFYAQQRQVTSFKVFPSLMIDVDRISRA